MKAGEFFKKIFSLRLWGNLGLMLLVIILLCLGLKFGIDLYTRHGVEIRVPDLRTKDYADAEHILEGMGLQVQVSDTGYVKSLPPDCILDMRPEPGQKVKPGRVIYVTINSSHARLLTMPDIIGNSSYRQARLQLLAMGFKQVLTEYVPGEKEWIYGLKANGNSVQNGQKVPVDAVITIVVGDGMRDMSDSVLYVDPEDAYPDEVDSLGNYHSESSGKRHEEAPQGDKDEFEVVTGP